MNEPAKENPKTSKRSKRRPAMEPLGWDEIVSQPGMGGYLSFLNGPVPLPHLQGPVPAPDPGVDSARGPEPNAASQSPSEIVTTPVVVLTCDNQLATAANASSDIVLNPGAVRGPEPALTPEVMQVPPNLVPEVFSAPAVAGQRLRIRRCAATHDGHSLGEEVLYQALWKAAQAESDELRTIVIGWRGMSQLCRMTPKNCKINTQRLIRKLALEVLSPYNTPESIGTTYRVYSDQAILRRRREAGLEWVVRSRGVDFVDPATGTSIMPICAPTYQSGSSLI
jgi:hypothetical protein